MHENQKHKHPIQSQKTVVLAGLGNIFFDKFI